MRGAYYELSPDKSPCGKEIEFIEPNEGNNGIWNAVGNDYGSPIIVPGGGIYGDKIKFVKRSADGSKVIVFPVKLKVYGKDGNNMEATTSVQVLDDPKMSSNPATPATSPTPNEPVFFSRRTKRYHR